MAQRPYWRGQIRISLVSLNVSVYTATKRSSQIPLHELDRKTGERIRHRNVNDDGDFVEDDDIVKAYEYERGEYVELEPSEIDALKLPSSDTLELSQFVDIDAIPPVLIERPYFVLPSGKNDGEIYAVFNQALKSEAKAGIGQIALRGREELCAVLPFHNGLILETLRYANELYDAHDYFGELPSLKLKRDAVDLAQELVRRNAAPFDISQYHDHYHEALRELIEAKKQHRKPRLPKAPPREAKVINFMDALQRSLQQGATKPARTRATRRRAG